MKCLVLSGPHAGRTGNRVGGWDWFGLRLTLNVPASEEEIRARYSAEWGPRVGELIDEMKEGHGPREWIRVWFWQVLYQP